jgi:hypothetical protein
MVTGSPWRFFLPYRATTSPWDRPVMPRANVDLLVIYVDTALPNGEDSKKEDTEHRPAPRFDTPLRGAFILSCTATLEMLPLYKK